MVQQKKSTWNTHIREMRDSDHGRLTSDDGDDGKGKNDDEALHGDDKPWVIKQRLRKNSLVREHERNALSGPPETG